MDKRTKKRRSNLQHAAHAGDGASMSSTTLPSASCHLPTPERLSRRDYFMQFGAPPAAPHDPAVGIRRQPGRHLGYHA